MPMAMAAALAFSSATLARFFSLACRRRKSLELAVFRAIGLLVS